MNEVWAPLRSLRLRWARGAPPASRPFRAAAQFPQPRGAPGRQHPPRRLAKPAVWGTCLSGASLKSRGARHGIQTLHSVGRETSAGWRVPSPLWLCARGGKGWGRGGGGHGQTAASWSRLPASRPLFSPLPSAKELLSQFSGLCQRKGSTPGCNLVSRGPASARPPAAILDCSPGCLRLHPAPSTAAVRERRTSVVSLLFSK